MVSTRPNRPPMCHFDRHVTGPGQTDTWLILNTGSTCCQDTDGIVVSGARKFPRSLSERAGLRCLATDPHDHISGIYWCQYAVNVQHVYQLL
jgi:hypothetical protein